MSVHRANVVWSRPPASSFAYDDYSREHLVTFEGGAELRASSAAEFKGDRALPNPEEQLVAALSTCHMLTFLAICARKGLDVDRYEDAAEGHLEKNAEGRLAVTRVTLQPRVTFSNGVTVDDAKLDALHQSAHHGCFIAASVKTEVSVKRAA